MHQCRTLASARIGHYLPPRASSAAADCRRHRRHRRHAHRRRHRHRCAAATRRRHCAITAAITTTAPSPPPSPPPTPTPTQPPRRRCWCRHRQARHRHRRPIVTVATVAITPPSLCHCAVAIHHHPTTARAAAATLAGGGAAHDATATTATAATTAIAAIIAAVASAALTAALPLNHPPALLVTTALGPAFLTTAQMSAWYTPAPVACAHLRPSAVRTRPGSPPHTHISPSNALLTTSCVPSGRASPCAVFVICLGCGAIRTAADAAHAYVQTRTSQTGRARERAKRP